MTGFLLICLLADATGSSWQKVKSQLLADAGALAPRRHELRPLLLGGLVLGLTLAADRSVSRELAKVTPKEIRAFEPLGRYQVGNVLGLAAAVGGLLGRRTDWSSCGVTLVEANLLASALVGGVQQLAGRARPRQAHAGEFGQGGTSFPSAHAAHAFSWAGALYGSWPSFRWRWIWPVAASGVALARVRESHHFLGDVAFGAALGWWIGFRLASAHRGKSPSGAAIVAIPGGLAYRLTWP